MKLVHAALLSAVLGSAAVPSVALAHGNEHTVSINDIPATARAALLREANGAPIQRVEVETKNGATIYEGVVGQGDQAVGIEVDGNGNVVGRHPEKGEEKGGPEDGD